VSCHTAKQLKVEILQTHKYLTKQPKTSKTKQNKPKQNKTKLTIVIICHRVILFPKGTPKPQTSKRVGLGAKKKKKP